jgi:hypothetical protein
MAKRKIPTLIIEQISDEGNLHLLCVLEHAKEKYLVIVDNITDEAVTAYVLDEAQQEGIDLKIFMDIALEWRDQGCLYPISFEFSKRGLSGITKRIYKTFNVGAVTRLVGNAFQYSFEPIRVRRRRAPVIQSCVEIKPRGVVIQFK